MATKIRLTRVGRKKVPFYHVVVADERSPRDGGFIEKLGYYNPLEGEKGNWNLKTDRVQYWLSTGAQPTSALARIFLSEGFGSDKQKKAWNAKYAERKNAVQGTIKAKADAEAKLKAAEEAKEAKAAAEAAAAEAAAAAGDAAEAAAN